MTAHPLTKPYLMRWPFGPVAIASAWFALPMQRTSVATNGSERIICGEPFCPLAQDRGNTTARELSPSAIRRQLVQELRSLSHNSRLPHQYSPAPFLRPP